MENLAQQSQSSNQTENAVLSGLEKLAQLSRANIGVQTAAFSKNALAKFVALPEERKQQIEKQIATMDRIVGCTSALDPSAHREEHDEWPLILKSLDMYGLHLKDDYKSILHPDDVIEVYSADHIQIFRTFNFYKYSAYSYLDLLVHEWYHLWERSRSILDALFKVGQAVVNGELKGIVSFDHVPQHVYKEIYNSDDIVNFEARSVLCKFGHICPLYKADNSIGGFMINCRAKVLSYGEETKSLSFI